MGAVFLICAKILLPILLGMSSFIVGYLGHLSRMFP
jgi:hypothetical protein